MKNVFEILRQKENELRRLQEEIEALRIAARLLADEHDQVPAASGGKPPSQTAMIRAVLEEKHEPMHVKEIAAAIEKKFRARLKPAYIGPVIYRQLDKIFYKADKPNTFGLLAWTVQNTAHAATQPRSVSLSTSYEVRKHQ